MPFTFSHIFATELNTCSGNTGRLCYFEAIPMKLRPINLSALCLLLISNMTLAANQTRVYLTTESHNQQTISGLGVQYIALAPRSELGVGLFSSLNHAKINDQQGDTQQFAQWEIGGKLGYFDVFELYAEIGMDMSEGMGNLAYVSLFGQDAYDEHNSFEQDRHDDLPFNVDGFVGIGTGISINQFITIGAFARYRQIDSEHWQSDNQLYGGLSLSVVF